MKEKVKGSNCPKCNKFLDAVTAEDGVKSPIPGDLSICFYCGELLIFNNNIELEKIPQDLFDSFDDELKEELLFTQKQLRKISK